MRKIDPGQVVAVIANLGGILGLFRAVNRTQDNALSQFDAGMLGQNTLRSVRNFVIQVVAAPDYARKAWEETRTGYSDRYIVFVEELLSAADGN